MKLLNRVFAGILTLTMLLSLWTAPALAAEQSDSYAASETAAAEQRAAEQSAEQAEPSAENVIGTVTGFGEVEPKEIAMAERLPLGELLAKLPETLGVYLDGSQKLSQIPVSWYCLGGYEDSNDFYFQFSPTWDEDSYPLSPDLDVERDGPYIAVYLADLAELGKLTDPGSAKRAVSPGNVEEVFLYLTTEMGLNSAAACGILANMHAESAMNPKSSCRDINGKTSYGLCQWNGSRFTKLQNWCSEHGENYTTVTGQLQYLNAELASSYPKVLDHLLSVDDTDEGAYDAAYYWCYYYEQPASRGKRSVERGNLARNTYWPSYGGSVAELSSSPEPVLSGVGTPEVSLEYGKTTFNLLGVLRCSQPMTEVTVGVYDQQGTQVTGATATPNTRIYSIDALDKDVRFSKLDAGDYVYRIDVTAGGSSYRLLEHDFTVNRKKLSKTTITLPSSTKTLPSPTVKDDKTTLQKDKDYQVSYKNGESAGTGLCVIIGKGNYAGKVKKAFQTSLTIEENQSDAAEDAPAEPQTGSSAQTGDAQPTDGAEAPVLTDASTPGEELSQGSYITVRGIVTAPSALSSVSAQVFQEDGSVATGGTAEVNEPRFNLKKLDKQVAFSKLTAGRYTYRVTVQWNGTTSTLLEHSFTVTPKAPTGLRLSKGKQAITVKWSKVSGAEGYEVQYSTSSNFSGASTVTVSGGQSSRKLTGLKKKKRYYVRVRSFVTQSGSDALSYSAYCAKKNTTT